MEIKSKSNGKVGMLAEKVLESLGQLRRKIFMEMTSRSNGEVGMLVEKVLESLGQPRSEDVILRVFNAIERDTHFRQRYDQLVREKGKHAINAQIGHSTSQLTGMQSTGEKRKAKNSLVGTYSRLR